MSDGEDVDFVFDWFVHDAVGLADNLAEPFDVCGNRMEADEWNFRAEIGECGKLVGGCSQFAFPRRMGVSRTCGISSAPVCLLKTRLLYNILPLDASGRECPRPTP
jgi:hypothetical protein